MSPRLYIFILCVTVFLILPDTVHAVCSNNEDGEAGQSGEIEFFVSDDALRYCDGTYWIDMVDVDNYSPNPIYFNGTDNAINNGSTVYTGTKQWTGSFWIRPTGPAVNAQIFLANGNYLNIRLRSSNDLLFVANDSSDQVAVRYQTAAGTVPRDEWVHVMYSFDAADPSRAHIYVNDVDITPSGTHVDRIIKTDNTNYAVGANTTATNLFFNGDIAEFWMDFGSYIDLSVESNRRKFLSDSGRPVFLGLDGSIPTGSVPDIWLTGATSGWHNNRGDMTGFDENGTLTVGTRPVRLGGLVGYWRLDETSGSSIADSSGYGNTGTWADGTDNIITTESVTGNIDNALDFEESDSSEIEVPLGGSIDDLMEMTICAWIYPESVPGTSYPQIAYKADLGDNGWQFYLDASNGTGIGFVTRMYGYKTADSPVTIGAWQHVCASWDGTDGAGGIKLYVDGTEIVATTDSGDFGGGTATDDDPLFIGSADGRAGDYFDGRIDDVRIYNRVMPIGAIQNIGQCVDAQSYYYNYTEDVMQWCTTTNYEINMHTPASGVGGCTSPAAIEGAMDYLTDVYRACDGNGWINIGIGK